MTSGPVAGLSIDVQGEEQLNVVASGFKAINDNAARVNDTLRETTQRSEEVARSQQSVKASFERLAQSYDPVLRSARQLEREERLLERAWRQGAVTGREYGDMMNKIHQRHIDLRQSAEQATIAVGKLGAAQSKSEDGGGFGGANWAGNRNRQLLMQGSQFFQQGLAGGFSPGVMSQAALMQGMDILPMMNLPSAGSAAGMAGIATLGTGAAVAGGLGLAYALGKNVEVFEEHSIKLREIVVGVVADVANAAKDASIAVYEHVRDSTMNGIKALMNYTETTEGMMKQRANNVIAVFKTVWDILNVNASDFGDAFMERMVEILNSLKGLAEGAVNSVIETIEGMLSAVATGVNSLRDVIASGLENLPGTEGLVETLRNTRAGGASLGRVSIPRAENPYAEGAARFRRNRADTLRENFGRDYIGEGAEYLAGAGLEGRERMQGWGDKASTDRAKEQTKSIQLETEAIKARTAAMNVDKNVREDALRSIDRELELKKTLIGLEKASPNARAAFEAATRSKWAAEDAQLMQERVVAQKDLNASNAIAIEGILGQANAYGLEKNAREIALVAIEREIALRTELANTHPSQHGAVRARHAGLGAAQDTLLAGQANAAVSDEVGAMGRATAYGRARLGVAQGTVGNAREREQQLRALEKEHEIQEALLQLGPRVSEASRDALRQEIQERQKLTDEIKTQAEAEQKKLREQSRSIGGSFGEYFAGVENSTKSTGQMMVQTFDEVTTTIGASFVDMATGVDVSLKEITKSLAKSAADMLMNEGIKFLIAMTGRALGLTVTAPTGGAAPAPPAQTYYGGVYNNGRLYMRGGGIVDSPTRVPMAEMGEGGQPEGVLPLRRTPDGRLGVSASGGGGGDMIIEQHVTVNPPEGMGKAEADEVAQQMSRALDGKINSMIEKKMANARRPGGTIARRQHWN